MTWNGRRRRRWAIGVWACLAWQAAASTTPRSLPVSDQRLANGLRVIIAEDHAAPVVSVVMAYKVGVRDEPSGRTGFAHLFEHLMFKGSANVGPGEHLLLVTGAGGRLNGYTGKDLTIYHQMLPANQLDLALFLEADRMRSLEITQQGLDNQRKAVQEERRQRVESQPYVRSFEALEALAYDSPAYEHPLMGSMADLDAATVQDVTAFFRRYYVPNNAVIAIAGAVKREECLRKVDRYFGSIPAGPAPEEVDVSEAPQTAERRATIDDPVAAYPRIDMAFKVPAAGSADEDALAVLCSILGGGRSSRLYRSIVRDQGLASRVFASVAMNRGPGLLRIDAALTPGKAVADLETAIDAELDRLKSGPIDSSEIDKARTQAKATVVSELQSTLSRAILLAEHAFLYARPVAIDGRTERLALVTADDVQRAARRYLTATNRSVIITTPRGREHESRIGGER